MTPFLNDIYVFSLHQNLWSQVIIKDSAASGDNAINKLCNHTAAVIECSQNSDKLLILGGVQSKREVQSDGSVTYGQPSLSGTLYILEFTSKMVRNSALK